MKAIKKNLKEQTGTNDRSFMYCVICGRESSANAGDYWDLPDEYEFLCCDAIMQIVTKETIYVPVEE